MSRNDFDYINDFCQNEPIVCRCRPGCCPPRPYPPKPDPGCCIGPRGPRGATGAVGTILGSYNTLADLQAAHPTGAQGDAYLVNGTLYVWDTATQMWRSTGSLRGATGATGAVGTILGSYNTLTDLQTAHPTGAQGDAYLVDGTLYVWDTATQMWRSTGSLRGATGATGAVGTILDSYDTLTDLQTAHPTGAQGDAYLVDGTLYVWDTATQMWRSTGSLRGATGATGATGAVGTVLGSYDTLTDLQTAHPTGAQGDAYLVDGALYIWNAATQMWQNVGDLRGATGATGPQDPVILGKQKKTPPDRQRAAFLLDSQK